MENKKYFFWRVVATQAIIIWLLQPQSFSDGKLEYNDSALSMLAEGCLAMNIYHEGRGESLLGQAAIAEVTINRVAHQKYPSNVCDVVFQHRQFSWTHAAPDRHDIHDVRAWQTATQISRIFLQGADFIPAGKATHYHTTAISPYWKRPQRLVARFGNHMFYRL